MMKKTVELDCGPIDSAPTNKRIIVYGRHTDDPRHREFAMAWLDRGDGRWYYSPQGGLLLFTPTSWCEVPEE